MFLPTHLFSHSAHKPSHKTVNSQRPQWCHQKYCNTFCLLIVRRTGEVAQERRRERKFPAKSVPEITLSSLPSQLLMAFGLGPQSILHNEILQHWRATQPSIHGFIHRYILRHRYKRSYCISKLWVPLIMKMATINSFVYWDGVRCYVIQSWLSPGQCEKVKNYCEPDRHREGCKLTMQLAKIEADLIIPNIINWSPICCQGYTKFALT